MVAPQEAGLVGIYTEDVDRRLKKCPDFVVEWTFSDSDNPKTLRAAVIIDYNETSYFAYSRVEEDGNGAARERSSSGITWPIALKGLEPWIDIAVKQEIRRRASPETPRETALEGLNPTVKKIILGLRGEDKNEEISYNPR